MQKLFNNFALRTTFIYVIFAGLWISFSDWLVGALVSDARLITLISMSKGWLFVAVTAFILYVQLAAEMKLRARQQAEITRLNIDLEQRVQARTAELQTTLQELEAFSYSVSHDLRAPLRAIDGFGRMLQEDYSNHLDQPGLDYLNRIHEASLKMSQLIDALLQLSRVTRSELVLKEVNLSQMAQELVAELFSDRPDVSWLIMAGIQVWADPTLMRVVLINLLGNAYKYTSHQESAQIELGIIEKEGRAWVYIRDNGVGFDMAYAGKLFQAFHRLHTDFDGMGIGLALVQRIIRRHRGEIRVEAETGRGATFYFYV